MQEETLRGGLEIMEEAIRYVSEHGQRFGDSPASVELAASARWLSM